MAAALAMDPVSPRLTPVPLPTLKIRGVVSNETKRGFKYSELVDKDLAFKMQGFDFLTAWTLVDHVNRVSQSGLTYVLEKKPCLHYVYQSLVEGLKKKGPILCNPQLLTRILYFGAGLPFCSHETASIKFLRSPSSSKLKEIKETPTMGTIDDEGSGGNQQNRPHTSSLDEQSPPPQKETPQKQIDVIKVSE